MKQGNPVGCVKPCPTHLKIKGDIQQDMLGNGVRWTMNNKLSNIGGKSCDGFIPNLTVPPTDSKVACGCDRSLKTDRPFTDSHQLADNTAGASDADPHGDV
jgi:hypothetical protein